MVLNTLFHRGQGIRKQTESSKSFTTYLTRNLTTASRLSTSSLTGTTMNVPAKRSITKHQAKDTKSASDDVNQFRYPVTEIGTIGISNEKMVVAPISVYIFVQHAGDVSVARNPTPVPSAIFKEKFHRNVNQLRYYTHTKNGDKAFKGKKNPVLMIEYSAGTKEGVFWERVQ